MEWRNRKNN